MSTTLFNTLLLDTQAWDLVLDSNGDIALAAPPYAVAQDVASAIRLFLGELWYDTTEGIAWFRILGEPLSVQAITTALETAALSVSGVVKANAILFPVENRILSGQVQFTTMDGTTTQVNF